MRRYFIALLMAGTWIAATGGGAAAQLPPGTTGYSPGVALDWLSWRTFAQTLAPMDGKLTFECWATDAETYPANPTATPPSWPVSCARPTANRFQVSRLTASHGPKLNLSTDQVPDACGPPGNAAAGNFPTPFASPMTNCITEEVRRNPLSFNFIASNGLYWKTGLAAAFTKNIQFPEGALELKADWVPVRTVVAWLHANGLSTVNGTPVNEAWVVANYYTTDSGVAGNRYAMLGLHISLKWPGFPDWVWATLEHQNSPGRCDTMGCYDKFGIAPASSESIAPHKIANQQYPACTKTPDVEYVLTQAKVPAVFRNYCLKATQTAATHNNLAVLDGNSLTERINANVPIATASCLTCHAWATVDKTGSVFDGASGKNPGLQPGKGVIGAFTIPPAAHQIDFIWGILNAN